ncbi:hypothetical protein FRB99_006391 [Tulasnella sp. 403]|nr:hypothetical protein FRB99_006391 [Tulasnella sp. 403]
MGPVFFQDKPGIALCRLCGTELPYKSPREWKIHVKGKRHKRLLLAQGNSVENGPPTVVSVSERAGDDVETIMQRIGGIAIDDDAVSITPRVVDFGTIVTRSLAEMPVRSMTVWIEATRSAIRLVSIDVHNRVFTYITARFPIEFKTGSSHSVTLIFRPKTQRGTFNDQLELTFQDMETGKTFTATLPVAAKVPAIGPEQPHEQPTSRPVAQLSKPRTPDIANWAGVVYNETFTPTNDAPRDSDPSLSVEVSHPNGLDLGRVDRWRLISKTAPVTKTLLIYAREVGTRLTSFQVDQRFRVELPGQMPFKIKSRRPRKLQISLATANAPIGRCTGNLKLTFTTKATGKSFMVQRTLLAEVADSASNSRTTPKASKRKERANPHRKLIVGPELSSSTSVPYVRRLLPFPLDHTFLVEGDEEEQLRVIQTRIPRTFNEKSYGAFWTAMIHIEEHQSMKDLAVYDLFGVPLTRTREAYHLEVPGLAEKRPSVLWGDSIHVCLSSDPEQWYEGRVVQLFEKEIALRFHPSFNHRPGNVYDVQFTPCRFPIRRMHEAVLHSFSPSRILFPNTTHTPNLSRPSNKKVKALQKKLWNPIIGINPPQIVAVAAILDQPQGSVPFIIYGPPGTGKTVTVVETIRQLLAKDPTNRIFACAPSNSAADLITRHLADLGPRVLFRLCASSLQAKNFPSDLLKFTYLDDNGFFSVKSKQEMEKYRVIVTTTVLLTKNWRSHPAILAFPNSAFYSGGLEACGALEVIASLLGSPVLPNPRLPIVFHGVDGRDEKDHKSPSHYNMDEVAVVEAYITTLLRDHTRPLSPEDIGVISPYTAQTRKLRDVLSARYPRLKIGSVEEFQAQERRVIILTTTRSTQAKVSNDLRFALGFLVNPRRMNVALTRARAMLVVVGNPDVLGRDALWRVFINFIVWNNGLVGMPPSWDPRSQTGLEGHTPGDMETLSEMLKLQVLSGGSVIGGDDDGQIERPWRASGDAV